MRENKCKEQSSACEVITSVFWDSEGILLVEFLERGATINFWAICADIKEVKTTNSKNSAEQEDVKS
jgi:hypothetical protein